MRRATLKLIRMLSGEVYSTCHSHLVYLKPFLPELSHRGRHPEMLVTNQGLRTEAPGRDANGTSLDIANWRQMRHRHGGVPPGALERAPLEGPGGKNCPCVWEPLCSMLFTHTNVWGIKTKKQQHICLPEASTVRITSSQARLP